MSRPVLRRPLAAGVLGCVAFLLIGWSTLLVPALIRSVRDAFGQSDAGLGVYYFVFAVAYASGSLGGGFATERLGRRVVLGAGTALLAAGLAMLGGAPSWAVFLAAALPAGLGAGIIDGGVNGLFLDLFRSRRGRALNVVHLFFSVGALVAPLAVGRLVEGGVDWRAILVGSAVAAVPVAVAFAAIGMPSGRRERVAALPVAAAVPVAPPLSGSPVAPVSGADRGAARSIRRIPTPLLMLGFAIACYVASEVGVSNWLVRFLERAPLTTATTALALLWGGLAVGRLVSARLADRFDHTAFAVASALAMSVALSAAILVPSLPISILLFGVAGFASGPIFPMIVAIGGDRYPDRSAAVGGFLSGLAVAGSVVYPPVMGFLSVTVGLTVAMLGNVVLGLVCAAVLVAVARSSRSVSTADTRPPEARRVTDA